MEQTSTQSSTPKNGVAKDYVTPTSFWDPERDRPRGRALVRLEVEVRNTVNLQAPRGYLLQPGKQIIDVYDDEVAILEAQVETRPDALQQAHLSYRLSLAEDAKQRVEGCSLDAEKFLAAVDAGNGPEREAYEYVRARSPISPEGMFRQTMKRDVLPLVSCKVVELNVPEPKREAVKLLEGEQNRYTDHLGAAIGAAIAESQKPLVNMLGELMKALAKK